MLICNRAGVCGHCGHCPHGAPHAPFETAADDATVCGREPIYCECAQEGVRCVPPPVTP